MGLRSNARLERLLEDIETYSERLAETKGEWEAAREQLGLADEYEKAKQQVVALEIALQKKNEDHARATRETEHKLGLHRIQIEHEKEMMVKEAETDRLRAVEEARLAVREGNLDAERKRFEQEIEFRTKRFEEEAATLRNLTSQILERLPKVSVERVIQENFNQDVPPVPALPRGGKK